MTLLYLVSDKLGEGDATLGKKLLLSFLKELAAHETKVDVIGCVNSAIFLTTEGSTALDVLKEFEARGTRIASCGTCLDHYGKREAVRIGEVGTMTMSVDVMIAADKVIRPN
jgi:selenium metabolism protein YedF